MVVKINIICLGADGFAFGELLGKAPQVTKGACSRLGPSFLRVPSLRSRSVGPLPSAIHGGGQLSPHPCGSAHSTRPPFSLHPSRDWRCLGFLCTKIKNRSKTGQKQIRSFPAKAGPIVKAKINPTGCMRSLSGTGFSREEAGLVAISFAVCLPTPSRLKPVPLCSRPHHFRCRCFCFCSSNA